MAKKKPAHKIPLGNIEAAIWANDTEKNGVIFNTTIIRSYKDGEGWKDTTSLRREDLPIAAKALDMAFAWIWEQQQAASTSGQGDE